MNTIIPKVFHQIWLGGEMPDVHKYLRDQMLELHPNWEYKFWNEKNLPRMQNEEFLEKDMMLKFKSDIIRYEILNMFGGLYVDTDFLFYKNMEECLQRDYFICRTYDNNSILCLMNGLLGFVKKQPIIEYMVNLIPIGMSLIDSHSKKVGLHTAYLQLIGPGLLRQAQLEVDPQAFIYAKKYFVPFNSTQMEDAQDKEYPDAYAIHLWNYNKGPKKITAHKKLASYARKNL